MSYKGFCDDDILRRIAKHCPELETLNLQGSEKVTDDGLKHFCQKRRRRYSNSKIKYLSRLFAREKKMCSQMVKLKEIFVENTCVGDEGIKHLLENCPSLEKIGYNYLMRVLYMQHKDDIDSLDKVEKYKLTHLRLCSKLPTRRCDDALKICVAVCPNLKSIYCSTFELQLFSLWPSLPQVEELTLCLTRCLCATVDVSNILKERGGRLTYLRLHGCTVSVCTLGQSCPHLNQLIVHSTTIWFNGNESLPTFHTLKEFTAECVLDSDGYTGIRRILRSSPSLERLTFVACQPFPSWIVSEILKRCKEGALKNIRFKACSVEATFLEGIILTCSTLEILNLYSCDIPDLLKKYLYKIADIVPNRPEISYHVFFQ